MAPPDHPTSAETSSIRTAGGCAADPDGVPPAPGAPGPDAPEPNAPAPHLISDPDSPTAAQKAKVARTLAPFACKASQVAAGPSFLSAIVSSRSSIRLDTGRPFGKSAVAWLPESSAGSSRTIPAGSPAIANRLKCAALTPRPQA